MASFLGRIVVHEKHNLIPTMEITMMLILYVLDILQCWNDTGS